MYSNRAQVLCHFSLRTSNDVKTVGYVACAAVDIRERVNHFQKPSGRSRSRLKSCQVFGLSADCVAIVRKPVESPALGTTEHGKHSHCEINPSVIYSSVGKSCLKAEQ